MPRDEGETLSSPAALRSSSWVLPVRNSGVSITLRSSDFGIRVSTKSGCGWELLFVATYIFTLYSLAKYISLNNIYLRQRKSILKEWGLLSFFVFLFHLLGKLFLFFRKNEGLPDFLCLCVLQQHGFKFKSQIENLVWIQNKDPKEQLQAQIAEVKAAWNQVTKDVFWACGLLDWNFHT